MAMPYNPDDTQSIIAYARRLIGFSLKQLCGDAIAAHGYGGKGSFGQILEKYYFGYAPNSEAEADFVAAGLELKSSPIKRLHDGSYRSKERLVLNIINYFEVLEEDFESSAFWKKNAHLLLVFYLYEADVAVVDYIIKLVGSWNFPSPDLEIIKQDWVAIQAKIAAGKAHELSEGDTNYLGACTKGGKGGSLRQQPRASIMAKQRAYAFKQGYVNHIIANLAFGQSGNYGKLIEDAAVLQRQSLEDVVLARFAPYIGLYARDIEAILHLAIGRSAKNYYANLVKAMLGIALNKEVEEFQKADIAVKTVRLQMNGMPRESLSFPAFRFEELASETWDGSAFRQALERKFLFVFFKEAEEGLQLDKVLFWNMPYDDLIEARRVWWRTKRIVKQGRIVQELKLNGQRLTNFPGKSESPVAHVRPHARNAADTYPLPTPDRLTGLAAYTKHCFWLNNDYIHSAIYLSGHNRGMGLG